MSTMPRRSARGEGRSFSPLDALEAALSLPTPAPVLDVAKAAAARALGLPKAGGLIGGTYARFMSENLPKAREALLRGLGLPTGAGAPAAQQPTAKAGPPAAVIRPSARPSPTPAAMPAATSRMEAAPAPAPEAAQLAALKAYLKRKDVEGQFKTAEYDTEGHLTAGYGHKVLPIDNLRQGQVVGDELADRLLEHDAAPALEAARAQAAEAGIDDPDFITALGSVNFQLGPAWTQEHKNTWRLIREGDYAAAAEEAARSKWNDQTPVRVRQLQDALRRLPPKRVAR